MTTFHLRASLATVLFGIGVALPGLTLSAASAGASSEGWTVAKGRLSPTAGGGAEAAEGGSIERGLAYRVSGVREARVEGPSGLSFRAMPGSLFRVTASGERAVLQVDDGVVADVESGASGLDVVTPAVTLRTRSSRVFVKVDAGLRVYAEHLQGSTGTVEALSPSGATDGTLAAGTFRAYGTNPATAPAESRVPAATAAPVRVVPTAAAEPPSGGPPPGDDWIETRPARTEWRNVPCAPGTLREGEQAQDCWELVQIPAEYTRRAPPPPCPPPEPPPCPPPPPPPCPAPPPPCASGCGELIRFSGVPVPVRADDTGRVPLGSAIGARGDCESCVGTECNRIPWVKYVEGAVCDVATFKVGCCLITIRPASRVRVHRLPDGSLQMWAPNIGKDLALIEVNENQFCYIGEDGFLVVGSDCQIEYFRGLVHLYKRRDKRGYDLQKACEGTTPCDSIPTIQGKPLR